MPLLTVVPTVERLAWGGGGWLTVEYAGHPLPLVLSSAVLAFVRERGWRVEALQWETLAYLDAVEKTAQRDIIAALEAQL